MPYFFSLLLIGFGDGAWNWRWGTRREREGGRARWNVIVNGALTPLNAINQSSLFIKRILYLIVSWYLTLRIIHASYPLPPAPPSLRMTLILFYFPTRTYNIFLPSLYPVYLLVYQVARSLRQERRTEEKKERSKTKRVFVRVESRWVLWVESSSSRRCRYGISYYTLVVWASVVRNSRFFFSRLPNVFFLTLCLSL